MANTLHPLGYGTAQGVQLVVVQLVVDPALSPLEPAVVPGLVQPGRFRARTSLYATYLRILDARRWGATIGEIDYALFGRAPEKGKVDAVQKKMKAAAQLVWYDYRLLFMR